MIKFKKNYKIELAKTLAGHWYGVSKILKVSGKDKFLGYYPSSTTILNAYPQSLQLTQWIAQQGWQESQRIKSEAGVRGTNIHNGIEALIKGEELFEGGWSTEEWYRLDAFVKWHREYSPEILATEVALYSRKHGYAGRADVVCKISGKIMVGDWKSSSAIHDHFPLQVASYAKALEENTDIEVVETFVAQFGAKNKNNYRFVIYPDWRDHFKTFLHVKETWSYDNNYTEDFEPPVLVLPETLKL